MNKLRCGISLCTDGYVHGLRSLDDGISDTTLCGLHVETPQNPPDKAPMCGTCIPLICAELGIPVSVMEDLVDKKTPKAYPA